MTIAGRRSGVDRDRTRLTDRPRWRTFRARRQHPRVRL